MTRDVWSDLRTYVFRRPTRQTHVSLRTPADRDDYNNRILQRLSIRVADYSVLNIHRIGIEAPTTFVADQVGQWRPDAGYWPNALARVLRGTPAGHVEVFLLGRTRLPFGLPGRALGLSFIPLFTMDLIRRQTVPLPTDVDNARYLLYRCEGGYPMGIFSIYIRSNIAAEGEREATQMFFVVSFDFFGRRDWLGARTVRPLWESIHNRVTAHSLDRFKAHCESAFARLCDGHPAV